MRRVRRAIEQAIVLAFTADTSQHKDPSPVAAEDLRDQLTQIIDGVIWIRAAKTIEPGAELTYNYQTEGEKSIQCQCRPNCRTRL